ncbi:MAG: RIP metalloprotease RseP [Rhodomicrobium sp.]|nr:RIP metalloprotease RseP [Rhodomicrobium sp.]
MIPQVLSSVIGQLFWWTVPFLLVLGVVVIVHELGHFLAARALGVTVEVFSVGFGPEIAGFYDRRGTRWRLAWIPLGGYVKFKGDESVASMASAEDIAALTPSQRQGNFHTAPLWRRTLIVLAGPFSNFLLSLVIFSGMVLATGIVYQQAQILCVEPGTPAAQAGLQAGDKILSVGGEPVRSFEDFSSYVVLNARSPIDIAVNRDGKVLNLRATPELIDGECVGRIGVVGATKPEDTKVTSADLTDAAGEGFRRTWRIIEGPFQFFGQLFRGNACASSLGGPVKIAEVSKTFASQGFINLIPLIAFISVSVGLFNLFPIPVLDGGHLLFYGAEAILGRPLSRRAQEIGFQFGFILLLMLMVYVTWNNVAELTRGKPAAPKVASVCRK